MGFCNHTCISRVYELYDSVRVGKIHSKYTMCHNIFFSDMLEWGEKNQWCHIKIL